MRAYWGALCLGRPRRWPGKREHRRGRDGRWGRTGSTHMLASKHAISVGAFCQDSRLLFLAHGGFALLQQCCRLGRSGGFYTRPSSVTSDVAVQFISSQSPARVGQAGRQGWVRAEINLVRVGRAEVTQRRGHRTAQPPILPEEDDSRPGRRHALRGHRHDGTPWP